MKNALVKSAIAAGLFSFAMVAMADPPVVIGTGGPGSLTKGGGTAPIGTGGGGGISIPSIGNGGTAPFINFSCLLISPTITYIEHVGGQKVEVQIPNPQYIACQNGRH